MSKTLRVRTRTGWTTKPVEDIDDNRLTAEEIDDTFLGLDDDKEPADATILKQANIVNNLTTNDATAPLSAAQGKVLKDNEHAPVTAGTGITVTGQEVAATFATTPLAILGTATDVVMSPATNKAVLASPPAIGATTPGTGKFTSIELTNGQIKFPATQNASTDANTLDDYEEGTWTPVLRYIGGDTGITYHAVSQGRYTKIGNLVTCACFLYLSNKGSATSSPAVVEIGDLPFSISNNNVAAGVGLLLVSNTGSCFVQKSGSNSARVNLFSIDTAGARTTLNDTNISNEARIMFSLTYNV